MAVLIDPNLGSNGLPSEAFIAEAPEVSFPGENLLELATSGVWIPQGPSPTINAQVGIPPNNDVNGAIQSIAPHPTDANIMYIGSVNGGVWKTTNATASNPTWVPLTDNLPSLSIGDIQFDLSDPTYQTLIVGTGRMSNFAQRGDDEIGCYYTTNGGSTWSVLNPALLQNQKVIGVAARGTTLMAASRTGGVYRSTNSGANWTNISGINGLSPGGSFSLVADATNTARFYVTVSGVGVFRTDNTGATWTNVSAGLTGATTSTYIRMAVHNSPGNNVVYAAVAGSGAGIVTAVFRSIDQGATWTAMDSFLVHNGGQQFPDTSLAADPTNPNLVYLAGDRIAASPFTGLIARGNASLAAGSQWTTIVQANAGNTSPHADTRDMEFMANGFLVESDDGGMYRRSNPTSSAGVWSSIAGNLQVFEIHDVAWNAISNTIVAGTQDNGTHQQPTVDNTTWNFFNGGDGGDVAVDNVSLAGSNRAVRYYSSQNLGGFRRQVVDVNNSVISTATLASIADPQFVTPIELNVVTPTRLLIGGVSTLYESTDQGTTNLSIGGPGANRNALVFGGSLGGVPNADVIYVGSGSQVWKRTAPGALAVTAALPAGASTIVDVEIDPNNYNSVFAVDNDQVFSSSNGGTTWTNITGNLGTLSAFDFRTVEFITGPVSYIAVGTRSGVFVSRMASLGTWFELGTGLPDVLVFDLDYNASDDVLIAGTLGRAVWKMPNASTLLNDSIPPTVTAASFLSSGTAIAGATTLTVTFSEPLANGTTLTNYQLRRAGTDSLLRGSDTAANPTAVTFVGNTATLTFAALAGDVYRLSVLDTLTDVLGNPLDGDANGAAGGAWRRDFVVLNVAESPSNLLSPNGLTFDVDTLQFGSGQFVQGTSNTFDGLNRLLINAAGFVHSGAVTFDDDGRTVVTPSGAYSGLTVSREVTIPIVGMEDFARTVDVFTNSTLSPITVPVRVVGNLGSDAATSVFATSDGDLLVEPTDLWFGTDDANGTGTAAIIHFLHGPLGLAPISVIVNEDNVEWTYSLTVNAGETKRLASFSVLGTTRQQAIDAANALVGSGGFANQAATFLTAGELASLANFVFPPATVAQAYIFYNDSGFETFGGVTAAIDNVGKQLLQSSDAAQTTSVTNVSNFIDGINGLVFDVNNLATTTLAASDFVFRMRQNTVLEIANPSTWVNAPEPTVVNVTPGAPSRIRLEWANNAIQNTWLQVILKANSNTRLALPVVFYIGHAAGEGAGGAAYRVGVAELSAIQAGVSSTIRSITDVRDVDKNRRVGVSDLSFVQSHVSSAILLHNITIPIAGSPAEGAPPAGPEFGSLVVANDSEGIDFANAIPPITSISIRRETTTLAAPRMPVSERVLQATLASASRASSDTAIPDRFAASGAMTESTNNVVQSIDNFFANLGKRRNRSMLA